jgi:hypothetical protein
MWIDWSAAQLQTVSGIEAVGLPLGHVEDVFIVRTAGWKLLTLCGQRAKQTLDQVGVSDDPNRVVAELRDLQRFGARMLTSYHTSLWTTDRYLVKLFDAIDSAWKAEREVAKTRELFAQVAHVLQTHYSIELEKRNAELAERDKKLNAEIEARDQKLRAEREEQEKHQAARESQLAKRDRRLAAAALALGAVTLISAMADIFGLVENLRWTWGSLFALVPLVVFIGVLWSTESEIRPKFGPIWIVLVIVILFAFVIALARAGTT